MESDKILKALAKGAKTLKKEVKEESLEESELLISEIYSQHIPETFGDSEIEFVIPDHIQSRVVGKKGKLKEIPPKAKIKIEKLEKSETAIESETTMECETCFKSFRSQVALRAHCHNHKINRDPALLNCTTCEKPFYSSSIFAKHVCILKPVCYYCNVMYDEKKSLLEHMDKEHRNSFDSNLSCNLEGCQYSCQRSFTMLHHLMSHYDPIESVCPYCSKYFNDWLKYRHHLSSAHRNKRLMICDSCGAKFHSRGNIVRHFLSLHLNKRVYCDECPNSYSTSENLKLHKMNTHGLESPFACSYCPTKFVHECYLRTHEEKHLAGKTMRPRKTGQPKVQQSFSCQYCGRCFGLEVNMKRHVRTVHLKIKEFICSFKGCNSAFAMKSTLQIHSRIHTLEKPYVCPVCPSACYSDPSTLSKHMKNLHKIKYTRPRQKKTA